MDEDNRMTDDGMMKLFVWGYVALQKELETPADDQLDVREALFGFKLWLAHTKTAALKEAAREMPFIVANNGGAYTWLNKRADSLPETVVRESR